MKKIKSSELKHGDVYINRDSDNINIFLTPFKSDNFKGLENTCLSTHYETMWYYDPRETEEEVYLITTLKDIGEIIRESLKNEED